MFLISKLDVFRLGFLLLFLVELVYPRLRSHLNTCCCLPVGYLVQAISQFSLGKVWQSELCRSPAAVHGLHPSDNFCSSIFHFSALFEKGE